MEPTQQYYPEPRKNSLLVPIAIVIAGGLIAGSLIYLKKSDSSAQVAGVAAATEYVDISVKAVTEADHTLGNPNATVQLIEYSDTDCPFCQRYHPTMSKLIDTYGKNGQASWTYRHFAFHERAPKEAEATECAAEVGGNDAFWKYLNSIFTKKHFQTSATDKYIGIEPADLPNVAASIGINKAKFSQCLSSGKYAEKIKQQYNDAVNAGAVGTPHTVIISKKEITRETKELIDKINLQMLTSMPRGTTPPFGVSKDKKNIVVSGAMDYALMDQLVQMVIRGNS